MPSLRTAAFKSPPHLPNARNSRRYGLYAPIRNAIGVDPNAPKDRIPFYKKFVAGGTAGALAAFFANPTDLMKVGQ